MLKQAFLRSGVLAFFSFLFVTIIGIGLGVVAAIRKNSFIDHFVSLFTYLGISVPEFFWGNCFHHILCPLSRVAAIRGVTWSCTWGSAIG